MVNKLDWDSNFFGINIGELSDATADVSQDLAAYDLIIVRTADDRDVQIPGFKAGFSEIKLVFAKQVGNGKVYGEGENVYKFDPASHNIETIYELAYESGKYSRFKLDHRFSADKFREMYRKWVDNSVNKTFADGVLVYSEQDTIMGFVTYKVSLDHALIGLIGVNPAFQRRGIGKRLLSAVENIAIAQGCTVLSIPTQEVNDTACEFYMKQSYVVHEKNYIKHYWKI